MCCLSETPKPGIELLYQSQGSKYRAAAPSILEIPGEGYEDTALAGIAWYLAEAVRENR
jgi:hypothetical protein